MGNFFTPTPGHTDKAILLDAALAAAAVASQDFYQSYKDANLKIVSRQNVSQNDK